MYTKYSIFGWISFFIMLTIPSYAQEPRENKDTVFLDEFYIEDVIVSVNKTREHALDVSGSLSTIGELEQQSRQIVDLTDVTAVTPNFHMPDYGTSLTKPVYIRGIGSKINEPAVGLYVDGIPYFEKAAFDFNFFDLEQIEILRGPQGTLYGRNTMGGIIRIKTEDPSSFNKTEFSLSYDNQNKKRINLNQNIPISEDLGLLLGGDFTHNKGYYNNTYANRKVGGETSYAGRLKLDYQASENLDLMWMIDGNLLSNNGYPYSNLSDSLAQISYNRKSSYNRDMLTTGLKGELQLPLFTINSVTSYQYLDDAQEIDQDFSPADLFFVNQDRAHHLFSQEFNISGELSEEMEYISGIFGFYQNRDKQVDVLYAPDAVERYGLPGEMTKNKLYGRTTMGLALFGQLKKSNFLLEKIDFSVGLRYDTELDRLAYTYHSTLAGNRSLKDNFTHQLKFSEWLPKASLQYNWSDQFKQFVSVTKGYKSGGFNSTFESREDETFKPEYSWNYETGLKWKSRKLALSATLFYIDWKDQQVYQIDTISANGTTGPLLKNAAESVSKGFEMELTARPFRNFSLFAHAGYTHATFENYVKDPGENEDLSGNFIPYVPRYSFSTGINYRYVINREPFKDVRFHVNFNGTGKHYWNDTNTEKERFYGILNGSVTTTIWDYEISLWGKNLLNTDYHLFFFEAFNNRYAQKNLPMRLGITIRARINHF